jgi:uncharacterized protein YlzI (FlbEa/FlbD family)
MLSTLTPAYNREYKSKKQIIEDFENNKDFLLQTYNGSTYINKEDIEKIGEKEVMIRYSNLTKVTIIKFNSKKQHWG